MMKLTTDILCDILLRAKEITPEQAREIKLKQDHQRMKILRSRGETVHRGRVHLEEEVSAIEVAASHELPSAAAAGKVLNEDVITEIVARHSGLPFRKIDPLKLNPEIITQILPRAFARKNVVIPIEKSDDRLIVAV